MAVWKNSGRQRLGQPVCNLYSLNAVARFFRVSHNRTVAFEQLSAIFPGHVAPVVRHSADGDREIVTMSWGFVMLQKERAPRRVTRYQGPIKKDGPKVDIEVYAFLTTTPNKLVATINHERMPVLLTREEEFDAWLNGAPHVAFALAQEYPPGQMRIVQEGFKKQDLLDIAA